MIASGLIAGFNFWGALLVAVALFFTSLFMATSFSFSGAHAWANGPHGPIGAVERFGLLQKAQARWHAWREEREQRRMRRKVEESRLAGRRPVPLQSVGKAEAPTDPLQSIALADPSDIFKSASEVTEDEEKESPSPSSKTPIFVFNRDTSKPAAKRVAEPKIAKGLPNYKLPSPALLREGERSQKLDEEELKQRARAIEAKCLEFDIQGRVTQINPGPVVTTFEFKPGSSTAGSSASPKIYAWRYKRSPSSSSAFQASRPLALKCPTIAAKPLRCGKSLRLQNLSTPRAS